MIDLTELTEVQQRTQGAVVDKQTAELETSISELLNAELVPLIRRIDELSYDKMHFTPVAPLTPDSDLDDVKRTLNYIVNYLNGSITTNG